MTPLRLRVDVCTYRALREGVPGVLGALRDAKIRATFLVAFGPDASGLALLKLLRPSYAWKVFRSGGTGTYGWASAFYGTLRPAPLVGAGLPDQVRRIQGEGHEVIPHGWDHRRWQDCLPRYAKERLRDEFRRMMDSAAGILGAPPRAFGAPAWLVTEELLALEEEAGFEWAADTRGTRPFLPELEGRAFGVPQLPVTLPTLDEALGVLDPEAFVDDILGRMRGQPEYCCFAAHAEAEGLAFRKPFERLLRSLDRPASPLGETSLKDLPRRRIVSRRVGGRPYDVCCEDA